MPKTTRTYWNPLADEHRDDWQPIEGLEGMAEELTLAIDEASGDYTHPAKRTAPSAPKKAASSSKYRYRARQKQLDKCSVITL
jgi:hypothetical protein